MSADRDAAPERLARLLRDVERALRRSLAVELALGSAAALVSGALVGTALAAAGVSDRSAALAALLAAAIGVGGVAARVGQRWRSWAQGPFAVARWLDGLARRRGRAESLALLDAAELHRDLGRHGESVALGAAAIDRVSSRAESTNLRAAATDELRSVARRMLLLLVGIATALLCVALVVPGPFVRVLGMLLSPDGLETVLVPRPPEPRLGDIRIDYRYPEYAARPPRTVVSPGGKIRALPGTEVTIETRAERPVTEAVLVLTDGGRPGEDEAERRIAVEIDGRRLRARFVVARAGRWRLHLVDETGARLEERRGHDIELEVDEPPRVRLLEPEESPLEVNEGDEVELVFEASDDFLLGEARVAWRVLGTAREGKSPLPEAAAAGQRRSVGRGKLALAALELRPGDRVAYSVEVLDNDAISGPKVGASETKELRLYSREAHHRRVLEKALAALDAVVHLLGDHLERPLAPDALAAVSVPLDEIVRGHITKGDEAVAALEEAVSALREDPLGRPEVAEAFAAAAREVRQRGAALRRAAEQSSPERDPPAGARPGVAPASSTRLASEQRRMVDVLERQAVYLSDLIDDQRMMDAESLAKALREQQSALRKALEEYARAPSEERRQAIAQAIEDIQARIAEIMTELAGLRSSIPQDFVNADALPDRAEGLDELRRSIEEGDLESAMASLDRMLGQTEQMLAQLQKGREELVGREYSEITERAGQLWDELGEVRSSQRELAERTEAIAEKVRARSQERVGDASRFVEEQVARLERAASALESVRPERHMPEAEAFELAERRVADGRRALEGRDFGAARDVLERALEQIGELETDTARRAEQARQFGDAFGMGEAAEAARRALQEAKPHVQKVLDGIDALTPEPGELTTPEEKRQIERFQNEQAALSKRTEALQEGLEELGEQLPIVGPEVRSALDDARSAMGQSGERLGRGDAPGALGQERRAMAALDRLSQQLEQAANRSGGGQGGAGVPLPFGQPRGGGRGEERGGSGLFDRNRVEIPKPEQYQAPSEFRQDILDAAKQGTVEAYRDAVRRYYEELVK